MITLRLTCGACPEQYDALDEDRKVGYLRLRHGGFTVECPDVGGDLVYEASPVGDGRFEDDERDYYLRFAVDAIQRWEKDGPPARPAAPNVEYRIDGEPPP